MYALGPFNYRLIERIQISRVCDATLLPWRKSDQSPVVRLYLASALQRMPLAERWDILKGLVRHSRDDEDHNLPLMYWYAAEPLAEADPERALAFGLSCGRQFRSCASSWCGASAV